MFTFKVLKPVRKPLGGRTTATPPRPKLRPSFKPRLEVLEDRVLLNNDVLIWNPGSGDGTQLASHAANWWDQTQLAQGVEAPGIGNGVGAQAWLSSAKSNSDITWDQSIVVDTILLTGGGGAQGGGGYNAQQTINSGVTVTASEGVGMSGSLSSLNVKLSDAQSKLVSDGGVNLWTNFLFSGAGTVVFDGGSQITIGTDSDLVQSFDTLVNLEGGSVMLDKGMCALVFGTANKNLSILINPQSSFQLYGGSNNTNNLITSNSSGNYFDVNGGTFSYDNEGAALDVIDVGILIEQSGALMVGSGGSGKGALQVDGSYTTANPAVTASVYMTSGTVQLSGGCGLNCTNDYYQSTGTLETTDSLAEWVQDGTTANLGTMTIAGGSLAIAQTPGMNQFGSLQIYCRVLDFSGAYDPKINAGTNGQCDSLSVSGTLNINPGSSLEVFVVGTLDPAKKGTLNWTIIQNAANNLNRFANNNDQMTGLTDTPDKPNPGDYRVSW